MDYQTITYDLTDGVAVITLNRPDLLNAMNTQMRAELLFAIKEAGRAARVVVMTGAGRAFCAGQDLGDVKDLANTDLERVLREEYGPLVLAIDESPVPIIAAVNGSAAGAGANLALAADVVIASDKASFLQAFARIGLIPDAGGTYTLPRLVGAARAAGAALFAEPISAKQAADWGMIWEAVPDDAFEARWRSRAAQLANGPTLAYANIRKALRASGNNTLEDQLSVEAQMQGACGKSRDFMEGTMAFLEKRAAKFEGR